MNPNTTRLFSGAAMLAMLAWPVSPATAQTAPKPPPTPASSEEAIQLSPFQVVSDNDNGYQAANTLGATRTNVAIRDLPMQMVDRDTYAQPRQFVGSVGFEF